MGTLPKDGHMIAGLQHALELTTDTATLYLMGELRDGDDVTLHRLITGLPPQIRTLRLDLHAMPHVDQGIIATLRPLLRYWRTRRDGFIGLSPLPKSWCPSCCSAWSWLTTEGEQHLRHG